VLHGFRVLGQLREQLRPARQFLLLRAAGFGLRNWHLHSDIVGVHEQRGVLLRSLRLQRLGGRRDMRHVVRRKGQLVLRVRFSMLLSVDLPRPRHAAFGGLRRLWVDLAGARDLPMTGDREAMSTRSMPFPPGSVVAGKYRVERLLGEGGMGWVVQAIHLQLDQRVALKFMHASSASESPEAVARFLREARAAARIQSEHVARVSDVGTLETGAPYLVMEYLEGQDLDSLLRTRPYLPVEEALAYALQACEGLAEAHAAGIVHRDLKPANLFLARKSDDSVRVKLLDFGISKLTPTAGRTSDGARTGTQNLMGSPLYMAPEQMRSSKSVDRRADIWSMGVILYEMLSGRSPFSGETLPEICARILADPPPTLLAGTSAIAPELEAVVFRCLEKEPERRFQDVAALARALAAFGPPELRATAERIARLLRIGSPNLQDVPPASGTPVAVAASSFVAQTSASFGTAASPARPRRSPAPAIGVAAAAVVAALLIAGVSIRGRHTDPPAVSAGAALTISAPPPPSAPAVVLAPSPTSAAPSDLLAVAPPLPTATQTPATRPASSATMAASLATTHVLSPATHPTQRPKPSAVPTLAKPSATTGFGGRD